MRRRLAGAALLQFLDGALDGFACGQAVEEFRIVGDALAGEGGPGDRMRGGVGARRQHHGLEREAVFIGEFQVALVARGEPKIAPAP